MVQPITEIVDNDDARPVIVQFQNSEVQEGEEKKLQAGIFKNPDGTTIAIASRNILYTGTTNHKDHADDLYNRFILASNRETGKVRLIAVNTAVVTAQFKEKPKDVTDNPSENRSAMNQLNKEFGSKKIKRITEQRERLKMNIEDVKEQLEQTVAGVDISLSESFTVVNAENDSIYRPPINREASTKEEVYVLSEIVPENVIASLEEEATHVLSSDLDSLDLTPFINSKLSDLQNSSNNDVLEKAELLLYIDYLIKFILKPARTITKKFVICQSSIDVNNHILDTFSVTSNAGRTRPLSMKDKTVCHILVLAMIAFDYQLDVESLSKNIKLGLKKMQDMGRVLAFTPQAKNKSVMVLKIPLPPAVSVSPRKRKRT